MIVHVPGDEDAELVGAEAEVVVAAEVVGAVEVVGVAEVVAVAPDDDDEPLEVWFVVSPEDEPELVVDDVVSAPPEPDDEAVADSPEPDDVVAAVDSFAGSAGAVAGTAFDSPAASVAAISPSACS